MKFEVSVEKRLYTTGKVIVDCDKSDQAVEMVQNQIDKAILQTTAVTWNTPKYEDMSFQVTGDVD